MEQHSWWYYNGAQVWNTLVPVVGFIILMLLLSAARGRGRHDVSKWNDWRRREEEKDARSERRRRGGRR